MRKLLFTAILAAAAYGCDRSSYVIKGHVEGLQGSVTLFAEADGITAPAAVTVAEKGRFLLKGSAAETSLGFIRYDFGHLTDVVVEGGRIKVSGSLGDKNSIRVTGTPANDAMTQVHLGLNKILGQRHGDMTAGDEQEITRQKMALFERNIEPNLDNLFAVIAIGAILDQTAPPDAEVWYDRLSEEMKNTSRGEALKEEIDRQMRSYYNMPYMPLALLDTKDKIVALSSLVGGGHWVLLDFWASWCESCLKEYPYLVEAYGKYHDKGLRIYAVSLDARHDNWTEAIKKHGMQAWTHVSELSGWQSSAAELYSVRSLPANFLISPEGVIVGRNLRGEALEKKLGELIK